MRTRTSVPNLDNPDGTKSTTDQDKSSTLNDFFCSVFTRENVDNIPEFENREVLVPLTDLIITPDVVRKKLLLLKPNKSPGPDGLHPRVLRELATELSLPLSIVINKSLTGHGIPQIWKEANVSPIYKKGGRSTPGNYRPVSLTSIVCKLTESIIKDHVMHNSTDGMFGDLD